MQVTVEIPDELATRLKAEGRDLPKYVEALVTKNAGKTAEAPVPRRTDFERFIADVTRYSEEIPELPEDAYDRAAYYRDHN